MDRSPGAVGISFAGSRLGVVLVPQVSLVELDLMLDQEGAQLVFEAKLTVMILLIGDVLFDLLEIGLADGEIGVSALPFEAGEVAPLFFEPDI